MKSFALPLVLLLVGLVSLPQPAFSQGKKKRRNNRTNVRASGVIKKMQRGVLLMETDEGDRYYVRGAGRRIRFSYTGKAEASWLYPGLMIQFRGKVSKKGKVVEPITALAVFTPSQEKKLGIKQDISSATEKLFRDVPADSGDKKKKKTASSKRKRRSPKRTRKIPSTTYLIAGKLLRYKKGEMTVVAPGATLKCKVAEDAKITIEVTHPRYVRLGDKVAINGYYIGDNKQLVYSNQISVTATETLKGKKLKRRRTRTRKPKRNTKKPIAKEKKNDKAEK